MEYVYAAMLLHKSGKDINEENLTRVLTASGIDVDKTRVQALVASLTEVNIDEAIKSAGTLMTAAPTQTAPVAPDEKKEEAPTAKKKEEDQKAKEETAMEGLGALFG